MKNRFISIALVFALALGCVLGSFSVAFAANNEGDSFLYVNSNYRYSFDELLDEFYQTCDDFGTVFTYEDVFFSTFGTERNTTYQPYYNKNVVTDNGWGSSFLGKDDRYEVIQEATIIENHLGYRFFLEPGNSCVRIGTVSNTVAVHYYTGASGNRLNGGGGSTGVGRPNDYYTQPGTDDNLPGDNNYYNGDTVYTTIIDHSTGDFNNIGDGTIVTAENGTTLYNPVEHTWYTVNNNDNRTYTTNNYFTYNTVNYYMPGSDQPLNTWNYFYELPDGRNSATLTEEDIAGLNLDFDVVNYKQATEDLTQKALFHFDGNIENSAPPSNRAFVAGEDYFPKGSWTLIDNSIYDGDVSGAPTGWVTNYNFTTNSGTLTGRSDFQGVIGGFYNSGISFPAGDYLITLNVGNLTSLSSSQFLRVFLTSNAGDYSGSFGYVVLDNTSNSSVSVMCSVPYATNNIYLKLYLSNNYSYQQLTFSNVKIQKMEWITSDDSVGGTAEFEFSQGAGYTFVDTQTPFNAAIYLDGNAHKASISLPDDSLTSGNDFTFSYRWYQEQTTSTAASYFRLGYDGSVVNNFVYVKWQGPNITQFGSYNSSSVSKTLSVVIPAGQWNTVTIVRSGNNFSLYFNGLLVSEFSDSSVPLNGDFVALEMASDSNVHYLDEILFASQVLYTENHVPRLIPWDTTNVLVLPDVTEDSIAVQATLPITGYRIGGVRPTFPDEGMVWMMVEGDFITMIQIYNGYMWVQVNGAVYYNGHWYQLENFNIHIALDDIDIPPDTDIVNPNNPSSPGGGSGGSGGGWLDTLFQELFSGVVDIIVEAIKALIGLIENVLGAVADFIGACFSVITIPLELVQPVGDLVGAVFSIFPSELQTLYVAGFALIILVSVIMWISGKH